MTVFEAHELHAIEWYSSITPLVSDYLKNKLKDIISFEMANQIIFADFGITDFFASSKDLFTLKELVSENIGILEEPNRAEYGDFQTNSDLANKVTLHLASQGINPDIIIEPTCGKGSFIIASLKNFKNISSILGVEIYMPYVWETKFSIIDFYLKSTNNQILTSPKTIITITHCNVFDFDFKQIAKQFSDKKILVIGNPPWVTNSKLGSLNSLNLPQKTNFKNHSGLDAMTGKGNFDIAEFITLMMLETFQHINGNLILLVKNSVIKNILFDQRKNQYQISSIQKYCIDSKKEFNVSVEASLFCCKLNSVAEFNCAEFNFYNNSQAYLSFGWLSNKFVSNIDTYSDTQEIDGECPFIWRQGLKHDCSAIMELEKDTANNHYINGLSEVVRLENDLVYGLLKSSDLKNTVITQTRKYTIVTQKNVGQETNYIKSDFPKTYQYLIEHQENFEARKSSIYNNKPPFSIFGIGDYSFKPFKVAISGLYKTFHFTLILPQEGKPVMLDDTCYLIGFDKIEFAVYAIMLLNSEKTAQFLQSITFSDAKRTFTKDVLMRINLLQLATNIHKQDLTSELNKLNNLYGFNLTLNLWSAFINEMKATNEAQLSIFG